MLDVMPGEDVELWYLKPGEQEDDVIVETDASCPYESCSNKLCVLAETVPCCAAYKLSPWPLLSASCTTVTHSTTSYSALLCLFCSPLGEEGKREGTNTFCFCPKFKGMQSNARGLNQKKSWQWSARACFYLRRCKLPVNWRCFIT
jgi:hypothetical protein